MGGIKGGYKYRQRILSCNKKRSLDDLLPPAPPNGGASPGKGDNALP